MITLLAFIAGFVGACRKGGAGMLIGLHWIILGCAIAVLLGIFSGGSGHVIASATGEQSENEFDHYKKTTLIAPSVGGYPNASAQTCKYIIFPLLMDGKKWEFPESCMKGAYVGDKQFKQNKLYLIRMNSPPAELAENPAASWKWSCALPTKEHLYAYIEYQCATPSLPSGQEK